MSACAASPAAIMSSRRWPAASAGAGAGDAAGAAGGLLFLVPFLTQLLPEPKHMSRKMIKITMMTATPMTSFILRLFHHILRRSARPLFTKRSACSSKQIGMRKHSRLNSGHSMATAQVCSTKHGAVLTMAASLTVSAQAARYQSAF